MENNTRNKLIKLLNRYSSYPEIDELINLGLCPKDIEFIIKKWINNPFLNLTKNGVNVCGFTITNPTKLTEGCLQFQKNNKKLLFSTHLDNLCSKEL